MSRIVKDTLRLVAITLIAGVLLSVVYSVTKDTIAAANTERSFRRRQALKRLRANVRQSCPAETSCLTPHSMPRTKAARI